MQSESPVVLQTAVRARRWHVRDQVSDTLIVVQPGDLPRQAQIQGDSFFLIRMVPVLPFCT
jgi:hypothetical protein